MWDKLEMRSVQLYRIPTQRKTAESQASGSASEGFGFSSDLSESGAGDCLLMPMRKQNSLAELTTLRPGAGAGHPELAEPSAWTNRDQCGLMRPSGSLKGLGPWPRLEVW